MQKCCHNANILFLSFLLVGNIKAQHMRLSPDSISFMNLEGGLCQDYLQIYVGDLTLEQVDTTLPITGDYYQQPDGMCVFKPIIPLALGRSYTIWQSGQIFPLHLSAPMRLASPRITKIYPSDDTLPQNLLKFHLEFSKPMASKAYEYIRLEDVKGNTIDRAFLFDIPELWDPEKKLLTLWLEPGRIKKGLGPSDSLGQILIPNEQYRLVIEPGLLGADGVATEYLAEKKFTVTKPETAALNPLSWELSLPAVGSFRPLKVTLDRPLDYHTIIAKINVLSNGEGIEGRVRSIENEHAFYFFPTNAWEKSDYTLRIDKSAEDLAGNRLNRSFETNLESNTKTEAIDEIQFKLQ